MALITPSITAESVEGKVILRANGDSGQNALYQLWKESKDGHIRNPESAGSGPVLSKVEIVIP